jgi:hypothetical protein
VAIPEFGCGGGGGLWGCGGRGSGGVLVGLRQGGGAMVLTDYCETGVIVGGGCMSADGI